MNNIRLLVKICVYVDKYIQSDFSNKLFPLDLEKNIFFKCHFYICIKIIQFIQLDDDNVFLNYFHKAGIYISIHQLSCDILKQIAVMFKLLKITLSPEPSMRELSSHFLYFFHYVKLMLLRYLKEMISLGKL